MNDELITALTLMCIATAITPGPNNFIVMTVSAKEGIRNAIPSYLGICIGFPFMVLAVSSGAVLAGEDLFEKAFFIKYIGATFLLYLSLKIFFSKGISVDDLHNHASVGFFSAFIFQWINPKAWGMVLSTLSLVGTTHYLLPSMIFFLVIFPCVGVWLLAGSFIRKQIIGKKLEKYLNNFLGVLLASSVILIL